MCVVIRFFFHTPLLLFLGKPRLEGGPKRNFFVCEARVNVLSDRIQSHRGIGGEGREDETRLSVLQNRV